MTTVLAIIGLLFVTPILGAASIIAAVEIQKWRARRAECAEVVAAAVALLEDAAR